jgi:hypothetical protein
MLARLRTPGMAWTDEGDNVPDLAAWRATLNGQVLAVPPALPCADLSAAGQLYASAEEGLAWAVGRLVASRADVSAPHPHPAYVRAYRTSWHAANGVHDDVPCHSVAGVRFMQRRVADTPAS